MQKNIVQLASMSLVGGLFGRGVLYAVNIILSRGLGADAIGIFAFGLTIIQIGSLLANIGLDETVQRFVPQYLTAGESAKLRGLIKLAIVLPVVFGTIVAIVLYSSRGLAVQYIDSTLLAQATPFVFAIPFYAAMSVLTDATRGFKEIKYVVYIKNISLPVVTLLGAFLAAYVFETVRTFVILYITATIVAFVLSIGSIIRGVSVDITASASYPLSIVRRYALPMMAITAVIMIFSKVDILMLSGFVSATEVGWYQVAFTSSLVVAIFSEAGTSIFPSLASELHNQEKYQQLETIYRGITKWTTSLTLAGVLGIMLFARDILLIFTIRQQAAEITLIILALAQLFVVATGPAAQILKMTGWERLLMINTGVLLLVNILLNYYLIPQYGIAGAAVATGFSLASINLLQAIELWYLMDITPHATHHWRGVVPAMATIPVIVLIYNLLDPSVIRVGSAAICSLIIYLGTVYALGFDEMDKALFKDLT